MISGNIRKPFLKLLPIQIAAVTAGSVNSLIDTLMTSRYIGPDAVAGIGFFSPMLTVTFLLYVVLRGTTILCGRAVGAGKGKDVISLFSTAMVTVTGYGLLLGLGCFCFRDPLTRFLGAGGAAADHLRNYIAGYAPGIPFLWSERSFSSSPRLSAIARIRWMPPSSRCTRALTSRRTMRRCWPRRTAARWWR